MPPSRGQLRPLLVGGRGRGWAEHRGETEHTLLNSGPAGSKGDRAGQGREGRRERNGEPEWGWDRREKKMRTKIGV